MSLEGLGKDYLQLLSPYLGPYGCMLAMTCKYMKNNIIIKKYPFITQFYERDGYLELLQWCFRHEWYIIYYTDGVPLSVLEWKFRKALHDPVSAFENACMNGYLDVIEYCIKKKYVTEWRITGLYSINAIEYLYHCKDVTLTNKLWNHFNHPEELYEWAYQYHSDKKLGILDEFIFVDNMSKIISIWIRKNFKNTQMMRNYLLLYTESTDIFTQSIV
jgi:hypothetical protein